MVLFDGDRWLELYHTLRQNKLRTFLTAFGVFWGVYMIIVLVGVGNGLKNGAYSNLGSTATNSVFLWARSTTQPYKGYARGRRIHFRNNDAKVIRETIPEIEYLAPRGRLRGGKSDNNVARHDKKATVTIYGDHPEIRNIRLMSLDEGRFLNQRDIDMKRKVAVIGYKAKALLFQPGEKVIGGNITIKSIPFQVVGVYRFVQPNARDEKVDAKAIILPLSTFQQTFNWGDRIGWFSFTVIPGVRASLAKEEVATLLARRHDVAPTDKRAFGHWNMEENFLKIKNLFTGIQFLIWSVGLLSLLAGAIGVSNIMLITVKERTSEIGIKRAVGATPFDIVSQIISESIFLTAISGYVGLVSGVFTLVSINGAMVFWGIRTEMFENPSVDISVALITVLALVIAGALAGLVPAIKAVQVNPVAALRYEQ